MCLVQIDYIKTIVCIGDALWATKLDAVIVKNKMKWGHVCCTPKGLSFTHAHKIDSAQNVVNLYD